jgi:hypothetical protein
MSVYSILLDKISSETIAKKYANEAILFGTQSFDQTNKIIKTVTLYLEVITIFIYTTLFSGINVAFTCCFFVYIIKSVKMCDFTF